MANTPYVDVTINPSNLSKGAAEVLLVVRPAWACEDIKTKVFDEGITNILAGFYTEKNPCDMVMIRVYGNNTEKFIDRDAEKRNIQLLHAAGCGSELYASFKNGICYEFIHGEVLDERMVRLPNIQRLVAEEMVRLHTLQVPGEEELKPEILDKLRLFLKGSPEVFSNPEQQHRYKELLPSKAQLTAEVEQIIEHLVQLNNTPAYTHNDLLLKNIVYNEKDDRCYFIDHEYGCIGFAEFDIADHFCEFAGVDTVDYALYPDKAFQLHWLRVYLESKVTRLGQVSVVAEQDVEAFYVRVNKFALACHLFWGTWALIQAANSSIDFDFLGYAVIRINEYFAKKHQFLQLQESQKT